MLNVPTFKEMKNEALVITGSGEKSLSLIPHPSKIWPKYHISYEFQLQKSTIVILYIPFSLI